MPDHGLQTEEEVAAWRLKMMTTQRFANLMDLADVIGDMGADGVEILRKLGDPDYKNMRRFLREAKSDTFDFLAGLREEEVTDLKNAIENTRAIRRTTKLLRKAILSTIAGIVAVSLGWDKISEFWHWLRGVK